MTMLKHAKIFQSLEKAAKVIPTPIYWKDKSGAFLGANKFALQAFGYKSSTEMLGKTDYDLWPKFAKKYVEDDQWVMNTEKILSKEDVYPDKNGNIRWCIVTIAPLYDEQGAIIGTIGNSIDITEQKKIGALKAEKEKIGELFKHLEKVADIIPTPIYWFDTNSAVLGGNKSALKGISGASKKDFIGRQPHDYYPHEVAEEIVKYNNEVIRTGKILSREETITDVVTHKVKYVNSIKGPLYDDKSTIVGVLGISFDITAEKEAVRLKLDSELQKNQLHEQEKLRKIAEQVAHDIRSPLASLSMIVEACKNLPEKERIALKEVATSISDIANNLLTKHKKHSSEMTTEIKPPQYISVFLTLSEVLSEKKYQYKKLQIEFDYSFEPTSIFAFIKADLSNFNRMISNLVNNAVEAFDDKNGKVTLKLKSDTGHIQIIIQDNGKGIPPAVLDKIMNNILVTSGKEEGSGIGLNQVRNTLQANSGKMSIESKVGEGTKIILTFPKVASPEWIANEITLHTGDIVVVLDDDPSIHNAWGMRFKPHESKVQLHHFKSDEDTIKFVNNLIPKEKSKVLLLSDFELINQALNGLQVIEKLKMQHQAILVTSHYNNQDIQDLAAKSRIKILPKQLASNISIEVKEVDEVKEQKLRKKVDMVIIDDMQMFADSLASFFQNQSLVVDTYYNPQSFLKNLSQYAKGTKICIDHNLRAHTTGFDLAKQLNAAGYTRLYLLSGGDFEKDKIPDYLTLITKGDMGAIINKILINGEK